MISERRRGEREEEEKETRSAFLPDLDLFASKCSSEEREGRRPPQSPQK